jgi:hypothetical protein
MEEARTSGIVTHKEVTMAAEPLGTKELYRKIEEFSEIIDMLRLDVSILMSKVVNLERNITSLPVSVRIVEVKETTVEEAKEEIQRYYEEHKGESIYPDIAADTLGLDLKITMQAVEELIKAGKLEQTKFV